LFVDGTVPQVPASVDAAPVADVPIDDPSVRSRVEDEIGDVLFVVANIARRWQINPEEALRRSNSKFERRVRYIERRLAAENRELRDATLVEMEALYQQGKQDERNRAAE
jgi:uncharacterized protein YabN with tetrapyrrole methylase and pyrophosphatase domain